MIRLIDDGDQVGIHDGNELNYYLKENLSVSSDENAIIYIKNEEEVVIGAATTEFETPKKASVYDLVLAIKDIIYILVAIIPGDDDGLTTKIDEVSGNITYIGKALIASVGADAVWQMQKLEKVGKVTSVLFADGDDLFDNVWNDRAILIYS